MRKRVIRLQIVEKIMESSRSSPETGAGEGIRTLDPNLGKVIGYGLKPKHTLRKYFHISPVGQECVMAWCLCDVPSCCPYALFLHTCSNAYAGHVEINIKQIQLPQIARFLFFSTV